ncbi:MAG: MBL fold metallo-hydrolase [Bacillota bacterium]
MTPRTSKFIAIAVAQGDAFFLERDGRTVLVDGGASARNFLRQFARATGRCKVDIVVCTHNDADHTPAD